MRMDTDQTLKLLEKKFLTQLNSIHKDLREDNWCYTSKQDFIFPQIKKKLQSQKFRCEGKFLGHSSYIL